MLKRGDQNGTDLDCPLKRRSKWGPKAEFRPKEGQNDQNPKTSNDNRDVQQISPLFKNPNSRHQPPAPVSKVLFHGTKNPKNGFADYGRGIPTE